MIAALCVLLYLIVGVMLFRWGVKLLGGKEAYKERMAAHVALPFKNIEMDYLLAYLIVVLFWPYYVVKTVLRRR